MTSARLPSLPARRPRGVFAILSAISLALMLGMIGLAIDLSMVDARGRALQADADATAWAAARALDGTAAGIDKARLSAGQHASASEFLFFGPRRAGWSGTALSFAATPDGPWLASSTVSASLAPTLRYARTDVADSHGAAAVAFMNVVGGSGSTRVARHAVARSGETRFNPALLTASAVLVQ